ncbi:hypothetical protein GW17_00042084 [Ensete ventricosum]|nr:hypothetical protein GW17_00042084 [Ensete ventricosum]RZS12261.1 hypothetical protein BHM03_00043683 [Ensete ventricosum]
MVRSPPPLFLPLAALPSSSAAGLRPPIDELEHSGSSWNASSKREERRGGNRSSSVTQKQFSLKSFIAIIRGKTGSLRSQNCTPFRGSHKRQTFFSNRRPHRVIKRNAIDIDLFVDNRRSCHVNLEIGFAAYGRRDCSRTEILRATIILIRIHVVRSFQGVLI